MTAMRRPLTSGTREQRGAVLLLSLIVLVILMISSVALVRSYDTAMVTAGNLAFKRDLVNQGERVIPVLMDVLATGGLDTSAERSARSLDLNYSARVLDSTPQGIPRVLLLDDAEFRAQVGTAEVPGNGENGITMRYVIDRLCTEEGDEQMLVGRDLCVVATETVPRMRSLSQINSAESAGPAGGAGAAAEPVVYRITVRVDGPRSTQTFLQATLTR